MISRVHVVIYGKVQGVWFRANTKDMADKLGLKGWVKNTIEGNVEAVFEGNDNCVNKMLEWCNHGPKLAIVKKVKIERQPVKNEFNRFVIKY